MIKREVDVDTTTVYLSDEIRINENKSQKSTC